MPTRRHRRPAQRPAPLGARLPEEGWTWAGSGGADGALLDALLVRALEDAVHEDAGRVDRVGVEAANRDDLLTSAMQIFPQVAAFGLKLREVLR